MKKYVYLAILLLFLLPAIGYPLLKHQDISSCKEEPLDLGVYPDSHDLEQAQKKFRLLNPSAPGGVSPEGHLPGSVTVNLSSGELTALLALDECAALPLDSAQVKLHTQNSLEISGLLLIDELPPLAEASGLSEQKLVQALNAIGLNRNTPLYMQGSISISNQEFEVDISQLRIGQISLPADEISLVEKLVSPGIKKALSSSQDISIDNLSINHENMVIQVSNKL